ncbi:MAG: hypothetical protein KDB87_21680, partial [Flavobacteriales bacterium]|nr:hypothetical protein [Flavobacteriales bacterium]
HRMIMSGPDASGLHSRQHVAVLAGYLGFRILLTAQALQNGQALYTGMLPPHRLHIDSTIQLGAS